MILEDFLILSRKISELWDALEAMDGLLKVTRDCLIEKKGDEGETYMGLGLDVIKCLCVLADSLRKQAEDIAMMTAEMD